jgi:hypothetical protein
LALLINKVLPFLLLIHFSALAGNAAPAYVNTNNVDARRQLEEISAKDPGTLPEPERLKWAKARLAWIALDRLEGREEEALKLFRDCFETCGTYAPAGEFRALLAWGCPRAADARPCMVKQSADGSAKKTKAQKPLPK